MTRVGATARFVLSALMSPDRNVTNGIRLCIVPDVRGQAKPVNIALLFSRKTVGSTTPSLSRCASATLGIIRESREEGGAATTSQRAPFVPRSRKAFFFLPLFNPFRGKLTYFSQSPEDGDASPGTTPGEGIIS